MSNDPDSQLKGSEVRLWQLIEERAKPGADKARIDQRIWDLFGEEWAVMFTDLTGFSRQVEAFGIIHFLQVIHEHKRLLAPIIADHDGILIKLEADSLMIVFRRAASALRCAIAMQRACQEESRPFPPEEKVLLCVGIGYGRVLRIGDHDVWGSEVNAASKLGEDLAKQNEIFVTSAVRDAVGELEGVSFVECEHRVPGSALNYRVEYAHAFKEG